MQCVFLAKTIPQRRFDWLPRTATVGPELTFAGCPGAALQLHQTGRSPQWCIQVRNRKSEEGMKALRQQ